MPFKIMCWKLLENYANTHTETSHSGNFTNTLLELSEEQILSACNTNKERYIVISTENGCTGAIMKLQQILGTYIPTSTMAVMSDGEIPIDAI